MHMLPTTANADAMATTKTSERFMVFFSLDVHAPLSGGITEKCVEHEFTRRRVALGSFPRFDERGEALSGRGTVVRLLCGFRRWRRSILRI